MWYEMSYNQPVLTMAQRLRLDFSTQNDVFFINFSNEEEEAREEKQRISHMEH